MKRFLPLGLIFLACTSLTGCFPHRNPNMHADLTRETWMREVDTNPNAWARGADNWFMTGDPNATELMIRNAPISAAVSTMGVRVSAFNHLKVNGDFQVQLIGTNGPNTVFLYGPNDSVRDIVVEVRGATLCISQIKNARYPRRVIVRIGVNQLNSIVQMGCGSIEGVGIHSNDLNIVTLAPGNVYLGGAMSLHHVVNKGGGIISVFGARTNYLDIMTASGGSVNVSGDVGVRSIVHHGRANINIIGAHSPDLSIRADGAGKVGLYGADIHLHRLVTRDAVRVFAYNVYSSGLYAYAYGNSVIGLAGFVSNLYADTYRSAQFQGRSLCAQNAYIRAHDWSHINISACNKIFAAATQNASVYFYGSPNIMSQFVNGNGLVMPIFGPGVATCALPTRTAYSSNTPQPTLVPQTVKAPNYASSEVVSVASAPRRTYTPTSTTEVPFSASTRNTTTTTTTTATTIKPLAANTQATQLAIEKALAPKLKVNKPAASKTVAVKKSAPKKMAAKALPGKKLASKAPNKINVTRIIGRA